MILLFLLGATIGPLLDAFHTHSHTLAYAHPWIFMMAWWTPPLFGTAAVAIVWTASHLDNCLKRPSGTNNWKTVLSVLFVFFGAYFLSGYWSTSSVVKTGGLSFIGLSLWYFVDRTWQGFLEAGLVAVGGCAVESFLISQGAFWYLAPDFAGIPFWLGPLYFNASMGLGLLGRKLMAQRKSSSAAKSPVTHP